MLGNGFEMISVKEVFRIEKKNQIIVTKRNAIITIENLLAH